jgi:hypothetical protein
VGAAGDAGDAGRERVTGDAGADGRAREGVEHLQAAAKEAIEAVRALLDVAERVVDDPAAVQAAAGSLATIAQAALQRVRSPEWRPAGTADDGRDDGDCDDGRAGRVQRIQVS